MIHTMTVQRKLKSREARKFTQAMGYTEQAASSFMRLEWHDDKGKPITNIKAEKVYHGVHEVSLSAICRENQLYIQYYAYIRIELMTLITDEKHIVLFECTPDNIKQLQDAFRGFMVWFLHLDGTDNPLNKLAELSGWDANRVDYTRDVRLRNPDEVLAFMNLCKLLTQEKARAHAKRKNHNTYGKNFTDVMYKFGNDSWEMEVYDKNQQINNTESRYDADRFQQLDEESQNIVRIEYRRLAQGTRKGPKIVKSRNIMEYLSEEVSTKFFYRAYESLVGYEPFYVLDYQLTLKLATEFPMNKKERCKERRRKALYDKARAQAKKSGKTCTVTYKKQEMGAIAQKYYNFLSFVCTHSGLKNAEAKFADFHCPGKLQFGTFIKNLRKHGIAPVCIPKNWLTKRPNGNGREMALPHDFLPNPIARPGTDQAV